MSPKVCKPFADILSQIPEVSQDIFINKTVAKHIRVLNDISKFQNEIKYR